MKVRKSGIPFRLASPLLVAAVLAACGGSDNDEAPQGDIGVATISNRADLVSDGDALTEILLPEGVDAQQMKVMLNGTDVTSAFQTQADGRILGLLENLVEGDNVVEVSAPGANAARLQVTNWSRGGSILSGEQKTPFFCATVTGQPATDTTPATEASGLGSEAYDAHCNIRTEYKFYYKTTAPDCSLALPDPNPPATPANNLCFKPFDPTAAALPSDLATTTTDAGQTVPYIVRVERGTMNRGIYDIAVLVDPKQPWRTALEAQDAWNGQVNFLFGGGGGQPHKQMRPASSWTDDLSLSRGWLVAVNTMTDANRNNNRVVTAETVMMMKEHIVDRYGLVKFAVATGCSAGSINASTVNSLQPGLLDGQIISCALLDYDTSHMENYECGLLVENYDSEPWRNLMLAGGYTQAQVNAKKAAINGHKEHYACQTWYNSFFGPQRWSGNSLVSSSIPQANRETGQIVRTPLATAANTCALPASLVWDPDTNPNGARCSPWDWSSAILGTEPSGVAKNPRDNTGVQYGLQALRDGVITPEEFVFLNENVGGLSAEGHITRERASGNLEALDIIYQNGMIVGKGLDSVAIIDIRGDDDLHPHWRSFALRARLDKENGHHDNHVMWRYGAASTSPPAGMRQAALEEMDKWLTNVKADNSDLPLAQKVVQGKPDTAFDYCLLTSDTSQTNKVTDFAVCDTDLMIKPFASPRQAAGGPRAEDVVKCQLKPVDAADYAPAQLNGAQLERIRAVFPAGVCDWSVPGVGQQTRGSMPKTYVNGPGGQTLPSAPVSVSAN